MLSARFGLLMKVKVADPFQIKFRVAQVNDNRSSNRSMDCNGVVQREDLSELPVEWSASVMYADTEIWSDQQQKQTTNIQISLPHWPHNRMECEVHKGYSRASPFLLRRSNPNSTGVCPGL